MTIDNKITEGDTVRERLRFAVDFIKIGIEMRKFNPEMKDANLGLAFILQRKDGTGQLIATLEAPEFCNDLEALVKEQNELASSEIINEAIDLWKKGELTKREFIHKIYPYVGPDSILIAGGAFVSEENA